MDNQEIKNEMGINKYGVLYDDIQDLTSRVIAFCGNACLHGEGKVSKGTIARLNALSDAVSKVSTVAHELNEHLAWDNIFVEKPVPNWL